MLDTFAYLRQYHVDPEVLNHILATERDRNKGILEYLRARFRARLEENTSVIFEKGNDETGHGGLSKVKLQGFQGKEVVELTGNVSAKAVHHKVEKAMKLLRDAHRRAARLPQGLPTFA